jgi:hypothetical protein
MKPLIKHARSFPVSIYIAGSYSKAIKLVQEYCDEVGYCVTVESTYYVYKGGSEHGIRVGLINYPRFPSDPSTITKKAFEIAEKLRVGLNQESYSVETPLETIWYSYRTGDVSED